MGISLVMQRVRSKKHPVFQGYLTVPLGHSFLIKEILRCWENVKTRRNHGNHLIFPSSFTNKIWMHTVRFLLFNTYTSFLFLFFKLLQLVYSRQHNNSDSIYEDYIYMYNMFIYVLVVVSNANVCWYFSPFVY